MWLKTLLFLASSFCNSEPSNFTPKSTFNLKNIVPFTIRNHSVFYLNFMMRFLKVRHSWDLDLQCFKLGNTTHWSLPSSLSWESSFLSLPKYIDSKSFECFYLLKWSVMWAGTFSWFLWFHCYIIPSSRMLQFWLGFRERTRF